MQQNILKTRERRQNCVFIISHTALTMCRRFFGQFLNLVFGTMCLLSVVVVCLQSMYRPIVAKH